MKYTQDIVVSAFVPVCFYVPSQPSVPVPVKMEGLAQPLILTPVGWGGSCIDNMSVTKIVFSFICVHNVVCLV